MNPSVYVETSVISYLSAKPSRDIVVAAHQQLTRQSWRSRLVFFRPDEFNRAYVQPMQDRWCVVSDFSVGTALPAGTVGFSTKVRDCELVAIGTEEFVVDRSGFVRQDLIGPQVSSPAVARLASGRASLTTLLMSTYQSNRTRGSNPPTFVVAKP